MMGESAPTGELQFIFAVIVIIDFFATKDRTGQIAVDNSGAKQENVIVKFIENSSFFI